MNDIEQRIYSKYDPEFIQQIHNSIFNEQRMAIYYKEKIEDYDACIIGIVRHYNGLYDDYSSFLKKGSCYSCRKYARNIWHAERDKNKKLYIDSLTKFEKHMNDKHGKLL